MISKILSSRILMNKTTTSIVALLILLLLPMQGFAKSPPILIYTALPPMQSLIEDIGGPEVTSVALVVGNQDHELYEPKPSQLQGLAKAQGYVTLGLAFERQWLAQFKRLQVNGQVWDALSKVNRLTLNDHGHHGHEGHKGHHGHNEGIDDPHVWLSPSDINLVAIGIRDWLIELKPEQRELFSNNYQAWFAKIDAADQALRKALMPYQGSILLADHPNWNYFARHYGLKTMSLEGGSQEMAPKKWRHIQELIKKGSIKLAFFEKAKSRELIKSTSIKTLVITPSSESILETYEKIRAALMP